MFMLEGLLIADHALFFWNGNPRLDLIYISFYKKGGGPMPNFFLMVSDKWCIWIEC